MEKANNSVVFNFEELEVYKVAREFRKKVYGIIKILPTDEKYALASQMRRASISIQANIAEGHGRYNWQDNSKFCRNARGSLCEVIDAINICHDEKYINNDFFNYIRVEATSLMKLINGYIRYLQKMKQNAK